MTTTRESVRNAIVAELKRQAPALFIEVGPMVVSNTHYVEVIGSINLDALADAIVEHVA